MTENPYDTLGVPQGAPFAEVRAAYIKLAKQHHPDKLAQSDNLTYHEEYFKRVTLAYKKLEDIEKHGSWWSGAAGTGTWSDFSGAGNEDWGTVFKKIFRQAVSEIKKVYHTIEVPVSLEEIHNKKTKKLEVFLRDMNNAMYVKVSCGDWPTTTVIKDGHIIKVHFMMKEHKIYHLDDILGTRDLYTTCTMTWAEYLRGMACDILLCDGKTPLTIRTAPFPDIELPIVFKGRGLWGEGDLYVKLYLKCPSEVGWKSLNPAEREIFLCALDAINGPARE